MVHDPPDSLDSLPSGFPAVNGVFTWVAIWATVEDEIPLAFTEDDRRVDATTPLVRHYAVRAHRVRPSKFDRPEGVAGCSSEECCLKAALSIEGEAGDCGEPFSGSMESVTTAQCGVRALFPMLCLHSDGKAQHS